MGTECEFAGATMRGGYERLVLKLLEVSNRVHSTGQPSPFRDVQSASLLLIFLKRDGSVS